MTEIKKMTDQKRKMIFFNLLVTCIASSFLSTALSTALPPIISHFEVNLATGQWLTSAYSLAMGIMMPLTAFLITRFPAKRLYLSAIALFLTGLAVCIFSPNFVMMMAGRIMQACSNGITTSMAQVILLTIYPPHKRGSIMGWYGLSVGAAPVIAPTLAGILVDSLGWRMIFIIPFLILAISFLCAWFIFEDVLETKIQKFDITSFALSAIAFGGITLGIGNISSKGLFSPVTLIPLGIGLFGSVIFTIKQLKMESPFLKLNLFAYPQFTISVLGSMLLYLIMMGGSLLMPLFVQSVLGQTATISGLVTLPGSLAMAFFSPLAGKLYDKLGMRNLAIVGSIGMLIGSFGMAALTMETPLYVTILFNTVRNIAIGFLMMPFVTWGIESIDDKDNAHGTALLTSLRTIAGAIGSAMFVGIMNSVTINSMANYGEDAGMHGVNIAFLCMGIVSTLLLGMVVLFIRRKKNEKC